MKKQTIFVAASCMLFAAACASSSQTEPQTTQEPTAEAASTATEGAPPASAAGPSAADPAAAPGAMSEAERLEAAKQDIEGKRLYRHPYYYEVVGLTAQVLCKDDKFRGQSGDGVIVIKDGKVVSFDLQELTPDPKDPSKQTPELISIPGMKGRAAPPIPNEIKPLFASPVEFSWSCM
jgi:hypothetical protein